jgi:hypothetical protein
MENKFVKKYISSSFSIKHKRNLSIRREANNIEDIFKDKYLPPNVFSIPEEIEPGMPRVTIESKNGHSQILFSQTSIDFNAIYTDEYISDYGKCMNYFRDRIKMITNAISKMKVEDIYYVGMINNINFETAESEEKIIEHLVSKFGGGVNKNRNYYDFSQKVAHIDEDKYFINLSFGNYRTYDMQKNGNIIPEIARFDDSLLVAKGISVNIDINNRFEFNVKGMTLTDKNVFDETEKIINKSEILIISSLDDIINTGRIDI